MKKFLIICSLWASAMAVQAQSSTDSTRSERKYQVGHGLYGEVGVLSNASIDRIRQKMREMGIKTFSSTMASAVLAKRIETSKFYFENRLIFSVSGNPHSDGPKSLFRGIGIGVDASPKFVNSKRWNVLVPIGWDLMLYQLRVKGDYSATVGQVLQNPNGFRSAKFYNGSWNLHGGVGVDYKMHWFPEVYDQVYLSAKAAYHLPVLKRGDWRGDDVRITDLGSFKANQLYVQLGLVFFPKRGKQRSHWMHEK